MPAWKQQLRRSARAEGHSLTPITRISTKPPKNHKLAEQPNSYDTRCKHCLLAVYISTFPSTSAKFRFKIGAYPAPELGPCTPARYKAATDRLFAHAHAAPVEPVNSLFGGSDAAA